MSIRIEGACLLGLLALASCASDRTLSTRCGDGVYERGEVCLGPKTVEFQIPFEVHALRVADFTGDQVGDLLVLGVGDMGLTSSMFLGDKVSPLVEQRDPLVSGCSAHPVTGSLDPDDITDLLVAACEPALIVFHGSSSGQFELGEVFDVPAATRTSSLRDVDDDGIDDLVILGGMPEETSSLSVLPGTGDGTFGTGVRTDLTADVSYSPRSMALTDLDGDGHTDAILMHAERPAGLMIARGQPGGSFSALEPLASDLTPRSMTLADLDEDGWDDLIVADASTDHVVTLRGDGTGLTLADSLAAHPLQPHTMTPYDLDRDDHLDVLVTDPELTSVVVLQGGEGGVFSGEVWVLWFDAPVDQLAVADVNADGVRDLIAGTFSRNSVTVHLSSP